MCTLDGIDDTGNDAHHKSTYIKKCKVNIDFLIF